MTYDAALFDMDGVLVEPSSRERLRRAARRTFEAFDVDPDDEHVDAITAGATVPDLKAVSDANGLDPERLWQQREADASRVQRRAVREGEKTGYGDLDALDRIDVPMGVVSSNQHGTVEFVLEYLGIDDRFRTAYGREPIPAALERKKPATHYVDRALSDLGVDPANGADVLFVGDSRSDVAAADAAGLDAAFLRRPHRHGYDLDREPTHEVAGLDEVAALIEAGREDE